MELALSLLLFFKKAPLTPGLLCCFRRNRARLRNRDCAHQHPFTSSPEAGWRPPLVAARVRVEAVRAAPVSGPLPLDELRQLAAELRARRPDSCIVLRIGVSLRPEPEAGRDDRGRHAMAGPSEWVPSVSWSMSRTTSPSELRAFLELERLFETRPLFFFFSSLSSLLSLKPVQAGFSLPSILTIRKSPGSPRGRSWEGRPRSSALRYDCLTRQKRQMNAGSTDAIERYLRDYFRS